MRHSASAWCAEIRAHAPTSSDYLELAQQVPVLSEWRVALAEDSATRKCLEHWEAFVQRTRIAVVLEQAMAGGELPSARDLADALAACPPEWLQPALTFVRTAPTDIALYLACVSMVLVGIERERRTGCAEWQLEASSGSPEMLQSLMFKWGPRFQRHRWTW